jgi:cytochrome P450
MSAHATALPHAAPLPGAAPGAAPPPAPASPGAARPAASRCPFAALADEENPLLEAVRERRLPSGLVAAPAGFRAPPATWLLGHVGAFRAEKLGFLTAVAREYGDAVPLRFGPVRLWAISDPAMIGEVLTTRAASFRKDIALRRMRVLLGRGLLTSEGEDHDRKHRIARPAFQQAEVEGYADAMAAATEEAVESWRDGAPIDVATEMSRLALAIAAHALFGSEGKIDRRAVVDALSEVMPIMERRFMRAFPLPLAIPTPQNRRLRRGIATLNAAVDAIVRERRAEVRAGAPPASDLLSRLMASAPDGRAALTDEELRDEVMTLLLAGHETTANALSFTLRLLSENPAALERARAEADAVLRESGGAPRRAGARDVPRLEWIAACFSEAMRLYPPAYMLGREATEDVLLGGRVPVRKGSIVAMSQYVVQRDPRWWKDPGAFRPERFLRDAPRPAPFTYFPFGGGKRACIGRGFAMLEGSLVLATILARAEVRVDCSRPQAFDPNVTLRPRGGMPALVRRRG